MATTTAPKPPGPITPLTVVQELSVEATMSAKDYKWAEAEKFLFDKDTPKFLSALAFQEIDYDWVEAILLKVTKLVDDKLNKEKDKEGKLVNFKDGKATVPGKVIVVPRGSFASRTALRGHVDLDLDLIFPSSFLIETDKGRQTIEQVLGTGGPDLSQSNPPWHDASGNLPFTKAGVAVVLRYVWLKLVHNPTTTMTSVNLPPTPFAAVTTQPDIKWLEIGQGKTLDTITRSITGVTKAPEKVVDIDFFVKVDTTNQGGQEVVVGVDKDGPLGVRQYQTTTFIPSGQEWVGNDPLPPIDRTALMALKWWKNSFADDATIQAFKVRDFTTPTATLRDVQKKEIKIKSHHMLSALNALHEVDITDPLYIPRTSSLPFSLVRVIDRMIKILTYVQRAYNPPQNFLITRSNSWSDTIPEGQVRADYPFPAYSCGNFDTLYKQLNSSITEAEILYKSGVIPAFLKRLTDAQAALKKANPNWDPNVYVLEESFPSLKS
jgi:hypothetical protein